MTRTVRIGSPCIAAVAVLAVVLAAAAPVRAQGSHPDDVYWDANFGNPGASNRVEVLAVDGTNVYAGGGFNMLDGVSISGIGRWDGNTWHPMPGRFNSGAMAIHVYDGKVYAGGHTTALQKTTFAWWDGAGWTGMGGAVDEILFHPPITDIVDFNGEIYAGGGFQKLGSKRVKGIARWDGTKWNVMDGGLDSFLYPYYGSVWALAADDDYLYVAGAFDLAGSVAAKDLARWDGQQWSPLSSITPRGNFWDMEILNGNLYVGGWLSFGYQGTSINNIGMWDGSAWHSLKGGANEQVMDIHAAGDLLYVTGNFTKVGGRTVNGVAVWDGVEWHSLGSGVTSNGWMFALAATDDGNVYVGGSMTHAGGVPSDDMGHWSNPAPHPSMPSPVNGATGQLIDVNLAWLVAEPALRYDLYFGETSNPPLVASGLAGVFDPGPLEHSKTYYWRLVTRDTQGNHATGNLWKFSTEDLVTARLVVSSVFNHCGPVTSDTVTIDITVEDNPVPIDAGGFDLQYDDSVLTLLSCKKGDLTARWGPYLDCAAIGPGVVRVGGFTSEEIPAGSYGVFARVKFITDCCAVDSTHAAPVTALNLTDDLEGLRPIAGSFMCETFVANGDVNGDGRLTSGDALCVFDSYLAYPRQRVGACVTRGWDVRSDVDCSGRITPRDALCIYEQWLDGSCSFCGRLPSPNAGSERADPQVMANWEQDGSTVFVDVRVAGITALEAFGFDVTYTDQLEFVGAAFTDLTQDYDEFDAENLETGHARVGGYKAEATDATAQVELLRLQFRFTGTQLADEVTIVNYVDDLTGAGDVTVLIPEPSVVPQVPAGYALQQNYPNPFNPTTEIRYDVPREAGTGPVRLTVFTVDGKYVHTLVNETQRPDRYRISWDARDATGVRVASGVYFYVLDVGERRLTRKLVVLK